MEKIKVDPFIPMPTAPAVLVGAMVGGKPNYLAVGFASGVNIKPPILCVSLNRSHHTMKGILENGSFSVNVPSARHVRECDYCGLVSGRSVDKSSVFGHFLGELGSAPMIEGFPIVCECRLVGRPIDFAMDSVIFGEVVGSYVDAALYKKGKRPDILQIDPLLTGLDRRYRRLGKEVGLAFSIGWEYASGRGEAGEAGEGGPRRALVARSPRYALVERLEPRDLLGPDGIVRVLAEIADYAKSLGRSTAEGPFLRREEAWAAESDICAGYVFASPVRGRGRVESLRIPGGRFAECLHVGPYEREGAALEALRSFIGKNGFRVGGSTYSFYRNDPATTSPDELETLISIPVKRG